MVCRIARKVTVCYFGNVHPFSHSYVGRQKVLGVLSPIHMPILPSTSITVVVTTFCLVSFIKLE